MDTPFAALSLEKQARSWRLPTYNGTKSYQNLLVGVYETRTASTSWNGYKLDTQINKNPLSLIRNGYYIYSSGEIYDRTGQGLYLQSKAISADNIGVLHFTPGRLGTQNGFYKGNGYSIRCLVASFPANSLPTVVLKAIRTYWLGYMG